MSAAAPVKSSLEEIIALLFLSKTELESRQPEGETASMAAVLVRAALKIHAVKDHLITVEGYRLRLTEAQDVRQRCESNLESLRQRSKAVAEKIPQLKDSSKALSLQISSLKESVQALQKSVQANGKNLKAANQGYQDKITQIKKAENE